MIEFEKTLEEKVKELEAHILFHCGFKSTKADLQASDMFNSIYASIAEFKKENDAHLEVLSEEIDCITKAYKKLAR